MGEYIYGQISKIYTSYPIQYFRLFFTEDSLVIARYAAFSSRLIEGLIVQTYRNIREHRQLEQAATKQQIMAEMKDVKEIQKWEIHQIRLKKKLTDASLEIELHPEEGFFGKKRNIKKFGFDKKEFEAAQFLMSTYFPDKFKQ